ncbi:MAG: hypothetical protein M0R30_06165 [Methanoregula sp.]|jgi:hypothetical protein|uniref:hypothetical protein n=1 Tax=Methanoregula sp. TaxID=2052170 RepID=UPI0025DBDD65|nr:hypothetical protein [Methanoregula sp.]MCK9631211.1 hypothetical protein [Methanoregula sp.]
MPENQTTANATAQVPFRTIAHIFDPDDPSPDECRELSDRAEEQIFHSILDPAKESRKVLCDRIEITLPSTDLAPGRDQSIASAVRSHFRLRAVEVQRNMRLTQRVGLREIRLTLAVCIPSFLGIAICSQFKGDPLAEVIENVLVIFCWVTIWQPFQSLVFDRWTQSETATVYRKIADMDISVRAA